MIDAQSVLAAKMTVLEIVVRSLYRMHMDAASIPDKARVVSTHLALVVQALETATLDSEHIPEAKKLLLIEQVTNFFDQLRYEVEEEERRGESH